ncbi:unnamed protein product [Pleuronectes platessa]|uniref:Uncharacterized protein n=1 Tax=Pleuronectes platessa TaxID=8262 RepID=A0A9N7YRE8_PLEPL|nr:unnamed protein product [Pleuronectes platessa]
MPSDGYWAAVSTSNGLNLGRGSSRVLTDSHSEPPAQRRLITAALRRRYRARCEPPSAGALGISAHASLRRRFRVRCEPGVTALERRLVQRRRNWKVLLRMR